MILLALGFAILLLIHFGAFILRAVVTRRGRASERGRHDVRRALCWPRLVWEIPA